ncbi:lasso RiPP family leader peptide-containing protein [Streptomyces sp. UNOC14_S4]|nr:lasso RiPP family leader peptide-containing protein [Streptomyces sp. UNOC14_S4]
MVKVPYQTPSLVDIGNFGELTTGFGGDASDGVFTFFKRTSDFAR